MQQLARAGQAAIVNKINTFNPATIGQGKPPINGLLQISVFKVDTVTFKNHVLFNENIGGPKLVSICPFLETAWPASVFFWAPMDSSSVY